MEEERDWPGSSHEGEKDRSTVSWPGAGDEGKAGGDAVPWGRGGFPSQPEGEGSSELRL